MELLGQMDQVLLILTLDELGPKAREKKIHVMEVPEMKLSATYLRERLRLERQFVICCLNV